MTPPHLCRGRDCPICILALTTVAGAGHQPPQEDLCATCVGPVPDKGAKAHWGGPGRASIVAWTCSEFCTAAYERNNQ